MLPCTSSERTIAGSLGGGGAHGAGSGSSELLTGLRMVPENRVELLLNGDGTFQLLWSDLSRARATITVQMYYAAPGLVSDATARVLCDRARAGARVRVLLDAFGAVGARSSWIERMQRCGISVARFRVFLAAAVGAARRSD